MSEERLLSLLTEQTERSLSSAEQRELDGLLGDHPEWHEDDFEHAAAATQLAFLGRPSEELPSELTTQILAQTRGDVAETAEMPAQRPPSLPPQRPAEVVPLRRKANPIVAWAGWIAAAAAILIAFILLWQPKPPAPILEDPGRLRAELIAKPGVVKIAWGEPAKGNVVWDPAAQKGYLYFDGLEKNDPAKNQYQLWIFDKTRDAAHPVDGGVFDATGDVTLVEIDPKIRVFDANMFAVTVEKPGGVVVSKREKIVALAKI